MLDLVVLVGPYAPLLIFVAAILDILFATGLILYGAAMISSVFMLHSAGLISVQGIIISGYLGTLTGNVINFLVGRYLGHTEFVAKRLQSRQVAKARQFLQHRGLFFFILVSRFIALVRPLYALVIGGLDISFRRFFVYESIIAFGWVIFWLIIIVQGERLYSMLT